MDKEKEDLFRFNPNCPMCGKKMSETITGRYKCDHCDHIRTGSGYPWGPPTKEMDIKEDVKFLKKAIETAVNPTVSLKDLKFHIEKIRSAPTVSPDVETSRLVPNKNGDIYPTPFLPHDYDDVEEPMYRREYLGKFVDPPKFKETDVAKMDRVQLRQAVRGLGRYPDQTILRMPTKMMQDVLLAEKLGKHLSVPLLVKQDETERSKTKTEMFAQLYGGQIKHIKHINKLVDRLHEATYPQLSMGAKVAEAECPICATGHKPKEVFMIDPKSPKDFVPGRYQSGMIPQVMGTDKVPLNRMDVFYDRREREIDVRCYSGLETPGSIHMVFRQPGYALKTRNDVRGFLRRFLIQAEYNFDHTRAYILDILAAAFRCAPDSGSEIYQRIVEEARILTQRELEVDRQRRMASYPPPQCSASDMARAVNFKLGNVKIGDVKAEDVDQPSYRMGVDWARDAAMAFAVMHTHDHIPVLSIDTESVRKWMEEERGRLIKEDQERDEKRKENLRKRIDSMIDQMLEKEIAMHEDQIQKADLEKKTEMYKPRYCKKCGHDHGCMHPREEEAPKKPSCTHPFLIRVSSRVANEMNVAKGAAAVFKDEDIIYACRDCHLIKVFAGTYVP